MSISIKTALHHWWPKGLSSFWVDDEDCITCISPDGEERRAPPAQFGGITNGHTVRLGESWSFSFESKFDAVDSRLPYLVTDLLGFEAKVAGSGLPYSERLRGHEITDEFMKEIGLALASLICRSPNHRNLIAKTSKYCQEKFGFKEAKSDKNLININISNKIELINRNFNGGKYIVAFSDENEFIFGDGFYTNMASESALGHSKTVVPITPTALVIYSRPTSYFTRPRLLTIRLGRAEVSLFNELVQVYSKNQLFFRSQRPAIGDAFKKNEFLQYKYHKVPWLEGFLEDVHRFRQ